MNPSAILLIVGFVVALYALIKYAPSVLAFRSYTPDATGVVRFVGEHGCADALELSYEVFHGDLRRAEETLSELSARGVLRPVDTKADGDTRKYEFPPYELAA